MLTPSEVEQYRRDGYVIPVGVQLEVGELDVLRTALDKVDVENGAMRVIPGSHNREIHEHSLTDRPNSTLNREIDEADLDLDTAKTIELKPGQVSVHDIGLVHGSAANTSGRRRAGFALRYTPATSWISREMSNSAADWTTMPFELVRGSNRHEGNDFTLGEFGKPWQ